MPRARRTSPILEDVTKRLVGMKLIAPAPALGGDLSIETLEDKAISIQSKLERYNGLLAHADMLLDQIVDEEKETRTYSGRVLAAIGAVYGKDSSEYELAGGTRTSEIKR